MKSHHRELISFLEQHGATNVRLKHDSRHPRLLYTFKGQDRQKVVAGSPSDNYRGTANTIADLRRELGPSLQQPKTPRRTMEDLMPNPRILPVTATPLQQPKPDAIAATGTVAHYSTKTRIFLPPAIVREFSPTARFRSRYLGNQSWELTLSHDTRSPKLYKMSSRPGHFEFYAPHVKGELIFGASPAEFVACDNQILVSVIERRPLIKRNTKSQRKPFDVARVSAVKPAFSEAAPEPPPAPASIPEDSLTARLRNALQEIRALEAQTIYRLVRIKKGDTEHWAWSAPRIE